MARTIVSYNASARLNMPNDVPEFPAHLGEVDGRHYLSVPEGYDIPEKQDDGVDYQVHTEALPKDVVKRLMAVIEIDRAVQSAIRAKYSMEDELGALRTGDKEVLDFIAECIAVAKAKKAALGLVPAAAGVA